MDDKAKLYVFAKKEVALIFIFMLLIALTSFFLGVKVGKDYSYEKAGFTPGDREQVDLLSGQEEKVNEVVGKVAEERGAESEAEPKVQQTDINKQLEKKIIEELEKETPNEPSASKKQSEPSASVQESKKVQPVDKEEEMVTIPPPKSMRDKYSGKYTIQLGSYRKLDDAEEFARGFKVRGYSPIINEVEIKEKGTWYRVSLGVFENLADAKEYVLKEKELFMGQDYVFGQFD